MKRRICLMLRHALMLVFLFFSTKELLATAYTLTVQTNGSGSVSLNPSLNDYPANSVVTATARTNNGWYFSSWTGDVNSTNNPLNITMTSNIVIGANFQATPSYELTIVTNGMGAVSLNPPGGSYLSNSVVSATAIADAGWVFANWAGNASGNANPLSITVNSDEAVTAVFAEPPFIDQAPQNVTTAIGDSVSFTSHAVGTSTLYYQWLLNNSKLNDATGAVLTITNVQFSQTGTYSIIVSNAYGVASNSATLTVTNETGTNVVSTATEAALQNAVNIGGLVTFGFNGTIALASTINVTNNVALDASGLSIIINGNNAVRLFNVNPGVTFAATNVVMINGNSAGQNGANGTGSTSAQNGFPGQGGAIFDNNGTVQLSCCTLASNSVAGGMGGEAANSGFNYSFGGAGQGGAIFVNGGTLLLDSVILFDNSAAGGPGAAGIPALPVPAGSAGNGQGGAIYVTNGAAVVSRCTLRSNLCTAPAGGTPQEPGAAAFGGALFMASGSVTFSNCSLTANVASGGNTPANENNIIEPGAAYGGAIGAISGTVTVVLSKINSNMAVGGQAYRNSGTGEAQGGAIFSGSTLLASSNTFDGNQALSGSGSSVNTDGSGGALYNSGSAAIDGCTFSSNLAEGGSAGGFGSPDVNFPGGGGFGGGIYNMSQMTMTNCTLALNSADGGGGGYPNGVPGGGYGGGICNNNGTFSAVNVTIASNLVAAGQGYFYKGVAEGANVANVTNSLALKNSIIAYPGANSNAFGTISDAGYNMSSDGSANFTSGSSFNFTDPQLRPLGYYGGPTFTMALSSSSPAVDFGTTAGAPNTDQRGLPRPSGPGVDMGAYELQQVDYQIPVLTMTRESNILQLSFEGQTGASYFLQRSTTLSNWAEIKMIGPLTSSAEVNLPLDDNCGSTEFFRLFLP